MKLLNLIKQRKLTAQIIENLSETEINYINSETEINSSPLFVAISKLNKKIIKKFFEHQKINLNIIANKKISLLNYAIDKNDFEVVELLINNERFKLLNFEFNYPLIQAFKTKNKDILKLLLNMKNIDLNIVDEENNSVLILVFDIDNKKYELTKLILENKNFIMINHRRDKDSFSALHLAAMHNKVDLMKLLITYGADINIKNINGGSLLHTAIGYQNVKTVEFLVEQGIDVNAKIQFGVTAINLAAYTENIEIISLLLKNPDLDANNVEQYHGLNAIQYLLKNDKESAARKIAQFIVNQELLQKKSQSNSSSNNLEIQYQINHILLKNKLIVLNYDFLIKPEAKKIFSNINNSNLHDHSDYVNKYITNYENLLNNKTIKIDQNNLDFLKSLKSYFKEVLLNINHLKYEDDLLKRRIDKSFNKKLELVKEFRQEYFKNETEKNLQPSQPVNFVDTYEDDILEEKRNFLKKEKQTPKFQQPKKLNIVAKKVVPTIKPVSNIKIKSKKLSLTPEQPNLLEIETWEKQIKKQNAPSKGSFAQSKSPISLIKNFPNFQESLINLNSIEFNETIQWWNNIIINADEDVINDLEIEIINKINAYDKKDRLLTVTEFEILQKIRKQNLEQEDIFPIIILHRNDIQDHEKGRPAISLQKMSITNQELVIPGTTRKIEYYDFYQYSLNGIETYFYLKNIILIDQKFNHGLWGKQDNIKLNQKDIKELLEKIDEFYNQKTKFSVTDQKICGSGISETGIREIGIREGAIPKKIKNQINSFEQMDEIETKVFKNDLEDDMKKLKIQCEELKVKKQTN